MESTGHANIISVRSTSPGILFQLSIDKINFRPFSHIPTDRLVSHWKERGLYHCSYKTENLRRGLECGGIKFMFSRYDRYVDYIISNPNHFPSFDSYIEKLKEVTPPEILSYLLISDLDLAFDVLNKSSRWIKERVIFIRKRCFERYVGDSFDDSTLYSGKHPVLIRLYDKLKLLLKSGFDIKTSLYGELVRIEISIKGRRHLPTQDISNLKQSLLQAQFNPFHSIKILDFELPEVPAFEEVKSYAAYELALKKCELSSLIKANGFHQTRKILNRNSNFHRDYYKLLKINGEIKLGEFYHQGIQSYFENPQVILSSSGFCPLTLKTSNIDTVTGLS